MPQDSDMKMSTFSWFVNFGRNCDFDDQKSTMVAGSIRKKICEAYLDAFNNGRNPFFK